MENSAKRGLQSVRDILQQTLFPDGPAQANTAVTTTDPSPEIWTGPAGRYDFDLAEFPFFHFDKNPDRPLKEPITYTDTIAGMGKSYGLVHQAGANGLRNEVARLGANAFVSTQADADWFWGHINYSGEAYRCAST